MKIVLIAGFAVGLIFYKRLSKPWRLVHLQLFLALVVEILATIISRRHYNTIILYNLYMIPEQVILIYVATLSFKSEVLKKIAVTGISLCLLTWFYEVYKGGIFAFANKAFLSYCILLSAAYLGLLMEIAFNQPNRLLKNPVIWLCFAHVLYFGCDIPLFSQMHYFSSGQNVNLAIKLYNINEVLAIVRYCLVVVGLVVFWQQTKERKTELT